MKLFKHLFFGLALFFLSTPAQAKISDTFNMQELSRSYTLSCSEQAALRHDNIAPPHFSGRPRAFLNDSESLVIYSPYLTAEERQTARQLFASVPKYALPIAYRGGAVYVFTRRSIVEAVPALAVEDNWYQDFGLYMAVERRLYLPFEYGEGIVRRDNGLYTAQRFLPSKRDPFRIINHETGHMIDNMLGAYSLNSKGEDGEYRLSNRPDFLSAIRSDLARLASKDRPISLETIRSHGYYMPRAFNGVDLGGIQPSDQRAYREVFAELWAETQGYNLNRLYLAYPETFTVVKKIAAFLNAQDKGAPVHCKLRD